MHQYVCPSDWAADGIRSHTSVHMLPLIDALVSGSVDSSMWSDYHHKIQLTRMDQVFLFSSSATVGILKKWIFIISESTFVIQFYRFPRKNTSTYVINYYF